MSKEIILRIKEKDGWAGVIKYKNCHDWIGPYLTRTGNIYTGLTIEDAERLEQALSYPKGHLAPISSFWTRFAVMVGSKEVILRPEISPEDELKFLFLKGHKRVQIGLKDVKPAAKYVLIDNEAEAERENKAMQTKREANREFDRMNLEEMRQCLRLYGHRSDLISNELVENKLFKLIEEDPTKFINKWVKNKNKLTEYLVELAISQNVIRRNKNVYTYGTDVIGTSLEDTMAYLDDPKNLDLREAIKSESQLKN
jgi:hypothetical protein